LIKLIGVVLSNGILLSNN